MGELTDIYDEEGRITGRTILRGQKIGEQDYIQAAAAVVQTEGTVLVTRRHPNKTQGGMWEFPGGGSMAGEQPLDTLFRELEEETGIRADKEQVTFLKRVYFAPYHLFLYVYLVKKDVKFTDLRLQDTEIMQAKFVTPEELAKMQDIMTKMDHQIYEELSEQLFLK